MKFGALAVLLFVSLFMITNNAQAQFQMQNPYAYGNGYYGGAAPCAYPNGTAKGVEDDEDEVSSLQHDLKDRKAELKEVKTEERELTKIMNVFGKTLSNTVRPAWWSVFDEHIRHMKGCKIAGEHSPIANPPPQGNQPAPPRPPAPPPLGSEPPPPPPPPPPAAAGAAAAPNVTMRLARPTSTATTAKDDGSGRAQPPKYEKLTDACRNLVKKDGLDMDVFENQRLRLKNGKRVPLSQAKRTALELACGPSGASTNEPARMNRFPASVDNPQRSPANEMTQPTAAAPGDVNTHLDEGGFSEPAFDLGIGGGFGGDDDQTSNPDMAPYNYKPLWKQICQLHGRMNPVICRDRRFRSEGAKPEDVSGCEGALDRYEEMAKRLDDVQTRFRNLESEIATINADIVVAKADKRLAKLDGDDDGDSGSSRSRSRKKAKSDNLPLWILGGAAAAGLVGEYFDNRSNDRANQLRASNGWAAQPYRFGSSFYPMAALGINGALDYGAIAGGQNGAFGCGQSIGGGGNQFGPGGQFGPFGNAGGGGSPFGNPYLQNGFNVGGNGLFNSGAGPWGMPNYGGFPNGGFGGGGGFGNGFPGGGGFGGGGNFGGFPNGGFGGGGGFGNGFPNGGFGGTFGAGGGLLGGPGLLSGFPGGGGFNNGGFGGGGGFNNGGFPGGGGFNSGFGPGNYQAALIEAQQRQYNVGAGQSVLYNNIMRQFGQAQTELGQLGSGYAGGGYGSGFGGGGFNNGFGGNNLGLGVDLNLSGGFGGGANYNSYYPYSGNPGLGNNTVIPGFSR
jgi:hypothetical protein